MILWIKKCNTIEHQGYNNTCNSKSLGKYSSACLDDLKIVPRHLNCKCNITNSVKNVRINLTGFALTFMHSKTLSVRRDDKESVCSCNCFSFAADCVKSLAAASSIHAAQRSRCTVTLRYPPAVAKVTRPLQPITPPPLRYPLTTAAAQ